MLVAGLMSANLDAFLVPHAAERAFAFNTLEYPTVSMQTSFEAGLGTDLLQYFDPKGAEVARLSSQKVSDRGTDYPPLGGLAAATIFSPIPM